MSLQKKRVLVVDDDSDVGLSVKKEAYGFEVDLFPDPEAVSKTFSAHCYDLVILDTRMSGMNGINL